MKKRPFGFLHETMIPVIGQGTWEMPTSGSAVKSASEAMRKAITDLGMAHIDTAEMYGSGRSEELIADAIQGLPRQDLFIVSKVLPQNSTYAGTLKACDASLKRLRTDYLDCYLLHWRGSVPLADTMRALEKLVDDGKIRSLGVSNFDVDDLEEALSVLQKHKIACNQVLYNLHTRGIERELVPFCAKHSIAIVGYTPFARKSIPSEGTAAGATLASIAKKHQVTERQVILSFLVRLDNSFAIPKAARFEHLSENAGAGAVHLDAEDIAGLDAAFPAPQKRVPLATL